MQVFFKAEIQLPAIWGIAGELALTLQLLSFLQHTLFILFFLFLHSRKQPHFPCSDL